VIKKSVIYSCIFLFSCWSGSQDPAISSKYDFKTVGTLEIASIDDYPSALGSGDMVLSSISYNFLKYGYNVNTSDVNKSMVTVGKSSKTLLLSCIITEFTDSKMVVVPFRHEDRGYTKTVVTQSSKDDEENKKSESSQSQTSTTTTHAGKIKEGERVTYSQSRVGIVLKMTDRDTGDLVWSNSYWYSGLEMQRTIESCVKTGIYQIKKLF